MLAALVMPIGLRAAACPPARARATSLGALVPAEPVTAAGSDVVAGGGQDLRRVAGPAVNYATRQHVIDPR